MTFAAVAFNPKVFAREGGAQTIAEFHAARMVIAPSIKTEGKIYQLAQQMPG